MFVQLDPVAGNKRFERALEPMIKGLNTIEIHLLTNIAWFMTHGGTRTIFGLGEAEPPAEDEIGRILSQHSIGSTPYRADILIDCHFGHLMRVNPLRYWMMAGPLRLVVECDGPWHDKIKQYHNDRKRDRRMLALGYSPLRYPAEEITGKRVVNCAHEIFTLILNHARRERPLRAARAATADHLSCPSPGVGLPLRAR
jgi:very-short-patch-repair endonuclease